ncbi:DNA-binding transcriptional regulator Fis [Halomonas denitrificans]|uniref:DNA-binding transcriptional regulator Fis n=1 Tax=Halomonas TaxID=2745 RepID=UPI001A8D9123|nr:MULTISPECIES: DNA-binding transcriptional regulator Fis [Halomonas]MED5295724.1 DNA-binding transcriptional regulator Fis [Pseudomonadota bacterium]MBN8413501.1 DNA-binding transcriptional regulator Fis [Halomonas litopenaei]MBY5926099.1 DNA-binding transcriptional regulator Fis [Halomonas sp. DP4Y7-2]MBY5931138.1 DNA-binding transcriptional regulator Fis [Halomonas sp. DP8Y7-3]MBY5984659.1 DNA-binding transcriptional regulator Fis [Halomonas sp. DP5Y7-2]
MTSQPPIDQSASASPLDTSERSIDGLPPTAAQAADERPLREAVFAAMERYFDHLDGGTVTDLHAMVMAEVEAPLLSSVLSYTRGNQTRAAEMLGLNRGTLRKKLKQYDLI